MTSWGRYRWESTRAPRRGRGTAPHFGLLQGGGFSGNLSVHIRGQKKMLSLTAGDGLLGFSFGGEGDFGQTEGERGVVHQALIARVHP